MELIPTLDFNILNGWLMLAVYFIGLTASTLSFPQEKKKKLFFEPHYPRGHFRWFVIQLGRISAIFFVVLAFFTSIRLWTPLFFLGLFVYIVGFITVMVSLREFRLSPQEELVTGGVYRWSRNPQWVGLVLVYLGTALAMRSGLHLLLGIIVVLSYHFQILLEEGVCLEQYGMIYLEYMKRVPRYLLV